MPCPICNKETTQQYRPFCTKRCADIDLHRWLTGSYTLEAIDQDEEETPKPRNQYQFDDD